MASDAVDVPLRSSGRVRKRPETLYDNDTPSGKRKRDEDATTSDSEESEEEDIEEEADEEELRDQARKIKKNGSRPANKKPKTNGTTSLPIRSVGKKRKAKGGVKTLIGLDAGDTSGIFAELFAEGKDVKEVVSEWLTRFEEEQSSALSEIINFVLRAAGCTSTVSKEQIEDPDAITDSIVDLQNEFQASNPTDYPLMAVKGRTAATVKHGVASFINTFCKSIAQNGMLYDQEYEALMENIQQWFSTMSTAANRPFRHTATVVSLLFMTGLCEIACELAGDTANSHRQAETERKKTAKNKARVSEIEKKAQEAANRQQHVEGLFRDWHDTVFIHRYKDIDAAIRRECAASLGDWIAILPSTYLDSQHTRYLGWMLSDGHSSVRLEAVKQMLRFYRESDTAGSVQGFTDKFRSRLVEMATSDAEAVVRTASIELLDQLREHGLLEASDVDAVGRLIFESDDKVRKAAARFLGEGIREVYDTKVDNLGGLEALEEGLPAAHEDDYDTPRLSWLKLKCLAETLQAYHDEESLPGGISRARLNGELILSTTEVESRFSLAADDLRDKIEEIDDWRTLAGYLLHDFTSRKTKRNTGGDLTTRLKKECARSRMEEAILLDVLYVSVRHEINDLADKLTSQKLKLGKKQRSEHQDELEEVVRHLQTILPKLLERYGESPENASNVLRLSRMLAHQAVQDLGVASHDELLDQAKQQFMSHTDSQVLDIAVQIILQAKSQAEESAAEQLANLWETVVLNFVQIVDSNNIDRRGTTSEDDLQVLINNLLRMSRLTLISDPTAILEEQISGQSKAPIDYMMALMSRARSTIQDPLIDSLEDKVAQTAAEIALFYLRWRFTSIKERVSGPNGVNIPYEELVTLATRRDLYDDTILAVMQSRKAKDEIVSTFAGLLLDALLSSGTLADAKRGPGINDDYTVFISELDTAKLKAVMRAFAGAETVFAGLAKKRLDPTPLKAQEDDIEVDDYDEDPLSDDEDEAEEEESQASQAKHEARLIATLLSEKRLCQLTSKIVLAVLGQLVEGEPTRRRVERNKQKLGNNFKEVCKFFDLDSKSAQRLRPKNAAKSSTARITENGTKSAGRGRKANAIDADSEEDDEIEDDEPEAGRQDEVVASDDGMEE